MRQISAYIESFILYFCYSNSSSSIVFMSHSHLHSFSLSYLLIRFYCFTYFLNYTPRLWFWRILFFFFFLLCFLNILNVFSPLRIASDCHWKTMKYLYFIEKENSFFNIIFEKGKEWWIYIYIYINSLNFIVLRYHSNPFLYYHNRIRFLLFIFDETFVYVSWLLFWLFATYFFPKMCCINYGYIL